MTRRAPFPGRPRARRYVLAAVALIAAAGIILFVLDQRTPSDSPPPHASVSSSAASSAASASSSAASASSSAARAASSAAVAHALAALLRQGTPLTGAPGYWKKPSATLAAAAAARMTPGSARSARCS